MFRRILTVAATAGALGALALALAATYRYRGGLAALAQADTAAQTGAAAGEAGDGARDEAGPDANGDAVEVTAYTAGVAIPAGAAHDVLVDLADGAGGALETGPGIVVSALVKDGPAARAGVRRGDIVLAVGGQTVDRLPDLHRALADRKAGDSVELKVQRGDDARTLTATLDDAHGRLLGLVPCAAGGVAAIRMLHGPLSAGARVDTVADGGPAAAADLRPGDVITAVDGQPVDAEHPLRDLVAARKPGDTVALTVNRAEEVRRDDGSGAVTLEAKVEPITVTATLGERPDAPGTAYLGVTYADGPVIRLIEGDDGPHPGFTRTFTWKLDSQLGRIFGHGEADAPSEIVPLPAPDGLDGVAPPAAPAAPAVPAAPAAHGDA